MQAHFNQDANLVTVTLSERNLLALLAQLRDPARSAPALERAGLGPEEPTILVQAQSDADHYADRTPGRMRVATEQGMVTISSELDSPQLDV